MTFPKIWETFDHREGGWTVPVKFADDLPAIALVVRYHHVSEFIDDDEIADIGYRYAISSCAYVVDNTHPCSPAFVNTEALMTDGEQTKSVLLLGGGDMVLESWLEGNFYPTSTFKWKEEMLRETRAIVREVVIDPPEWLINWLRSDIQELLNGIDKDKDEDD